MILAVLSNLKDFMVLCSFARSRLLQKLRLQQSLLSGRALLLWQVFAAGSCSMLDPEGSVEHKPSSSFPKVFLIPLAMLLAITALLLLAFSATQQKETDFYTFKVVNIRGKLVSLEKYRGSVSARSLHVCGNQGGWRDWTLTRCTQIDLHWSGALPVLALISFHRSLHSLNKASAGLTSVCQCSFCRLLPVYVADGMPVRLSFVQHDELHWIAAIKLEACYLCTCYFWNLFLPFNCMSFSNFSLGFHSF